MAKLSRQARNIMDLKCLPYFIQATLAEEGYCSVEDLADRWDKAEDARANGPKELKFEVGSNGYTAELTKLVAIETVPSGQTSKTGPDGFSCS